MDAEDLETRQGSGTVARWILVAFGTVVALVWLVASQGIGMGLVVPTLLSRAAPEGWDVQVASVDGDWRSRVHLTDITLDGPSASGSVDRLTVRYRLLPLLRKVLIVREIDAVGPSLKLDRRGISDTTFIQSADTSGSALELITGSPLGDWRVVIGDARISGGSTEVRTADGAYRAHDVALSARGELGSEGLDMTLDSLVAGVRAPSHRDPLVTAAGAPAGVHPGEHDRPADRGRLWAAGALRDGVLDVTEITFASERSDVRADGRLMLAPGEAREVVDSMDFRLRASPLDLRDLPMTIPEQLRGEPSVVADLSFSGPPDSMRVEGRIEAEALGIAEVHAVARPPVPSGRHSTVASEPAIDATVDLLGADLQGWTPPPFDGMIRGQLSVVVDRWKADRKIDARATLVHDPPTDTVEGLFGRALRAEAIISMEAAGRAGGGGGIDGAAADIDSVEAVVRLFADDRLDLGEIAVAGTPEGGTWSVDLQLDSGTMEGQGRASRVGQGLAVVVEQLHMSRIDARALDPGFPSTSVSGTLRGEVEGEAIGSARGAMAIALGPSRIAETRLDRLSFTVTLDSGDARGRLVGSDASHYVDVRYHVSASDSAIVASLTDMHVTSVPASNGASDGGDTAGPDAALDLRGRADGRWMLAGDARRGSIEVRLDSSHVGAVPLHGLALDASLDGTGTSLDDLVGILDATAVLPRGGDPADSMSATIRSVEPGRYSLDARLHTVEGGEVVFDGEGSVGQDGDSGSFRVAANGTLSSPSELLNGAALGSVSLEASAHRDADAWTTGDARLLLMGTSWRALIADSLWLEARLDSDQLHLDTVHVASNLLTLGGSGMLPLEGPGSGSIELTGALRDLEPVRTMIDAEVFAAGRADLRVSATGALDSAHVAGAMEVRAIAVDRIRLDGIDATLGVTLDRRGDVDDVMPIAGSADVTFDRIALPHADVESVALRLAGDRDSLRVEASALADERRRGELLVVVDPRVEYRVARLDYMDLELFDDEWHMVSPAELIYRDGYELSSFVLLSDDSRVAIEGGVDGDGALDLDVQIDSVGVGTVSDLIGLPGLEGWLGGTVRLRGSTSAPEGSIAMRGAFQRGDGRSGPARIDITADGMRADTNVELLDPDGGSLHVTGSVPLPDADASAEGAPEGLDLTVQARDFGIVWALPFLDPQVVTELEGRLDGQITVQGQQDEPRLGGRIALAEGSTHIRPLGVGFHDMAFDARGVDSRVIIDSARVSGPTGRVTASGSVSPIGEQTLDVVMSLDEFRPIDNDAYQATISGDLDADGTILAPELSGRLRVESADIFLDAQDDDGGLEQVELTEEDLQMLRDRFAYVADRETPRTPIHELLTADLQVEFGRDSWIRKEANPDMAIAFTGDVEVRMRPGEDPQVFGELEAIEGRGYVSQFGRRFELESGTVSLSGPPSEAFVDVSAAYGVPSRDNPGDEEATILLDVSGTRDSLDLELSSDPTMENADIVSYIATGRPAASTLTLGGNGSEGGGIASAGANLALNQIVGAVEESAARSIGLDVVEIRREGFRGATLVAGSYVSPRIYVGFAQPVTLTEGDGLSLGNGNESEVEIELEALQWLLVNIEGSGSALSFFLRGRYAY